MGLAEELNLQEPVKKLLEEVCDKLPWETLKEQVLQLTDVHCAEQAQIQLAEELKAYDRANGMAKLAVMLAAACHTREKYQAMNIADQIFLDTIRSRGVTLNLKPVPDERVKEYLMEQLQVPDYQADICAAFAQGNIGKAVRLASSEDFNSIKASAMQLIRNAGRMEISDLIDYVKEVQEYKVTIQDYLDILALWYRDMVYFKATKDFDGIVFKDEIRTIRDTVKVCSYEGVEEVMKAIENAKTRLSANVNFDLTMELLFLVIKENIHG